MQMSWVEDFLIRSGKPSPETFIVGDLFISRLHDGKQITWEPWRPRATHMVMQP